MSVAPAGVSDPASDRTAEPRRPWIRHEAAWATIVAAILIAPVVIAIGLMITGHGAYRPGFDNALMELRVRDALHHFVYTGPYSRYGWYHPGPFLFYVDAIAYKLSGESTRALPVAALVINGVALGAMTAIAYRIGRLPAVIWVALPTALLMRTLGADFLGSPWNPDVSLLMFFVFLLAAWALAVGTPRMAWILVVVGSFIVQNHVGYALPVVVIGATATVILLWNRRRAGVRLLVADRALQQWGLVALAVALWALPIYGDLVAGNSNLRDVARFALDGGASIKEPKAGALVALRTVGAQWGPRPVWALVVRKDLAFNGAFAYSETRWWFPVLGLLSVVGLVVAWRRARRMLGPLAVLLGVGFAVAVASVASMRGLVYTYLTQWNSVLGAGLGIVVVAGLWYLIPERWLQPIGPAFLAAVLVVVAVIGVGLVQASADARIPSDTVSYTVAQQQAVAHAIGPPTVRAVAHRKGVVVLDTTHSVLESPGLALELERAGIPVRVIGRAGSVPYGPDRQWHCGPYRARITVLSDDDVIAKYRPPWPRVAHWVVPYTAAERQRQQYVRGLWASRPPSPERTLKLTIYDLQLDGPKYEVSAYVSPAGVQRCR